MIPMTTEQLNYQIYIDDNRKRKQENLINKVVVNGTHVFSKEELGIIQQVYSEENQYIISAYQEYSSIRGSLKVDKLLGIKKELRYVPASTISAIISQGCGIALWVVLREEYNDPKAIYNRLVEEDRIGFKKENKNYLKPIPLGMNMDYLVTIKHIHKKRHLLVIKGDFLIENCLIAEIVGFISWRQ